MFRNIPLLFYIKLYIYSYIYKTAILGTDYNRQGQGKELGEKCYQLGGRCRNGDGRSSWILDTRVFVHRPIRTHEESVHGLSNWKDVAGRSDVDSRLGSYQTFIP